MSRLIITILLVLGTAVCCQAESKWIIARSGTPNLVPDTLTSLALAIVRGAESVELNVALSSDGQLLLGDPDITSISDADRFFPDRKRPDGNYYVADFTFAELRQLSLSQPEQARPGDTPSTYPLPGFAIDRFEAALGLIRSLEDSLGRSIRIVVVPRKNHLYRDFDRDLSSLVIAALERYGYKAATDGAHIGSYDPDELRRIKDEVQPAAGNEIPLLQLVDNVDGREHLSNEKTPPAPYNYDWMFTKYGLKAISAYADTIGLPTYLLLPRGRELLGSGYLENIRLLGMSLLYYPVAGHTPPPVSIAGLPDLEELLFSTGLDGAVTTTPQQVQELLEKRERHRSDATGEQPSIEQLIETIRGGTSDALEAPLPDNPFNQP